MENEKGTPKALTLEEKAYFVNLYAGLAQARVDTAYELEKNKHNLSLHKQFEDISHDLEVIEPITRESMDYFKKMIEDRTGKKLRYLYSQKR